jgi:hypothetical protein
MKKLLVIILIGFTLLFSECKKYPEGPSISFRSKKERIANNWKLQKYIENDVDKTADFNNINTKWNLLTTKEGAYTITREFFGVATTTEKGTWALTAGNKNFALTPTSISAGTLPSPSSWQILKLFEKEFWVRSYDSNNKKIEYHLIPQ